MTELVWNGKYDKDGKRAHPPDRRELTSGATAAARASAFAGDGVPLRRTKAS